MKFIFIVYNISIEEDVQALLKNEGVVSYTQWPRLVGVGEGMDDLQTFVPADFARALFEN